MPGAVTTTAAALLGDANFESSRSLVLEVIDVDPDGQIDGSWIDHLACWAAHRPEENASLYSSVVSVTAPELAADQLLGTPDMAAGAGLAASTFRAYNSRGEADIPPPQVILGKRPMWSRAVAEEWAERRRHSTDGAAEPLTPNTDESELAVGITDVWQRYTQMFAARLWENPDRRRRWALRWRNEASVQEIAKDLAWSVAAGIDGIAPTYDMLLTIRHAFLYELVEGRRLAGGEAVEYGFAPANTRTLDWLIRHEPRLAAALVAEIVGDAERNEGIARVVVARSLSTALSLDGRLDYPIYREFLERALPPGTLA